jgi:hypothetical protein
MLMVGRRMKINYDERPPTLTIIAGNTMVNDCGDGRRDGQQLWQPMIVMISNVMVDNYDGQ